MDTLLESIEKSCSIGVDRKSQYKFNSKGGSHARDARREDLLDRLKRKRDDLLKEKRGLLDDNFCENDEGWMDWQESKKSYEKKWINHNCKDQLMLSEWLLDRPYNLETEWTCVLCPEGKRTIVVAKQGSTKAYQKKGYLLAKFKSILPFGCPAKRGKNSDMVILDCIWNKNTKQLFALDVLHWRNQTLLDCDAQFRLFWLKSRFAELRLEKHSLDAQDIFLPPHCQFSQLCDALAENKPSDVDGILFYHNKAPYVSGQTPLVGWLKPYMLAERFNLPVPTQYLALRPDTYINLEQWVALYSHDHVRGKHRRSRDKKMDCSEDTCDSSTSSGCKMEATSTEEKSPG